MSAPIRIVFRDPCTAFVYLADGNVVGRFDAPDDNNAGIKCLADTMRMLEQAVAMLALDDALAALRAKRREISNPSEVNNNG